MIPTTTLYAIVFAATCLGSALGVLIGLYTGMKLATSAIRTAFLQGPSRRRFVTRKDATP